MHPGVGEVSPSTLTFASHGARVAVQVDDPALLVRVATLLPAGARLVAPGPVDSACSIRTERGGWRLTTDEAPDAWADDVDALLAAVASAIHFLVAIAAPDLLFLHAGVVGWHGHAIVVPAPSGSGKTRLVMALLDAGAAYYSDEYAVFDRTGRVHAYPKALSVRRGADRVAVSVAADELGAVTGSEPIPVGLVVLTRYEAGALWQPSPVSPATAVLGLLANTVLARTRGPAALRLWSEVAQSAPTVTGRRGGAESVVPSLLDLSVPSNHEGIRWSRSPGRSTCS